MSIVVGEMWSAPSDEGNVGGRTKAHPAKLQAFNLEITPATLQNTIMTIIPKLNGKERKRQKERR